MNRDWYKPMVALMWLVLPITAANYWSAWDQLPARIAVHFDANWQPNGYTNREGAADAGSRDFGGPAGACSRLRR